MSELVGLYEIIEDDPRAFLKFISNACENHLFEQSICCACPMYKFEKGKGECKFMKRIPVRPNDWDCYGDKPASKKRIRPGTSYIHVSDVERVFSDTTTTIDEKDCIVPDIGIPDYIKTYVKAYENTVERIKQLESDHMYEFISSDLIEKLNCEANQMTGAFGASEWFHVNFRENDFNSSMLLYKITPKDRKRNDDVYKWLTTTEGAEYYAANSEPAKTFIHDYEAGAFKAGEYKEI